MLSGIRAFYQQKPLCAEGLKHAVAQTFLCDASATGDAYLGDLTFL
jgi:phage gp36-like protein